MKVADSDQREMHISVGCAMENLLVAAEHSGYGHLVAYFPEGEDNPVACVKLNPGGRVERPRDSVLFARSTECC